MLDRDKWGSIILFAFGVVLFGIGVGMAAELNSSAFFGIGIAAIGGVVLGAGGIAAFRWKRGFVSRRRMVALVGSFLIVGAGGAAVSVLVPSEFASYGLLALFVPVFVYWLHAYRSETGANRTDERLQLLAYKSGFWTLAAITVLAGVLLSAHQLGLYAASAEAILVMVSGIGLFGWYGAFRYFQTYN